MVNELSSMTLTGRKQLAREIDIHTGLHHEHIVELYAVFEDKGYVCMVLEEGTCDLRSILEGRRGTSSEAWSLKYVIIPVLKALQEIHAQVGNHNKSEKCAMAIS
jgi:serine/threonine protein kinase